jgi:hypothetical protein
MRYCTAAVARQQPANNRRMVFSARSAKQQLNSNRGTVFSVGSVPRCYKQDSTESQWSGVERRELLSELEDCCGSVVVSCCCEKLVAEAWG